MYLCSLVRRSEHFLFPYSTWRSSYSSCTPISRNSSFSFATLESPSVAWLSCHANERTCDHTGIPQQRGGQSRGVHGGWLVQHRRHWIHQGWSVVPDRSLWCIQFSPQKPPVGPTSGTNPWDPPLVEDGRRRWSSSVVPTSTATRWKMWWTAWNKCFQPLQPRCQFTTLPLVQKAGRMTWWPGDPEAHGLTIHGNLGDVAMKIHQDPRISCWLFRGCWSPLPVVSCESCDFYFVVNNHEITPK